MIEQIKTWLKEQGFPLEMQTATAFRRAGFEVTQANLFKDLDTGKSREIDVFAEHRDYVGVTQIAFVVECKSSKKPWLLLCDPEVLTGHNRVQSFAFVNQNALKAMLDAPVFDSLMEECTWFRKDELTGYSLRTAFSDNDIAYEAASSVAKASLAFVNSGKNYQQRVAFPVIVISSPLVRCQLDEEGNIQAEEITQGEVFFKYDLTNPWSCVRVVTLAALQEFACHAAVVAASLRAQLFGSEEKLWEAHFSSPYPQSLSERTEDADN
jgi:hypothetical protein